MILYCEQFKYFVYIPELPDENFCEEAVAKKKKKDMEEASVNWELKKNDIEQKMKEYETFIYNQNEVLKAAMSRGLRLKEAASKKAAMSTAVNCQEAIDGKSKDLKILQSSLVKHMEKKPKRV